MSRIIKMKGKKAGLAVLEKSDLEHFYKWFNDLDVTIYLTAFDKIYSREAEEEWYNEAQKSKDKMMFGIIDLRTGKIIGNITLRLDRQNNHGEIGIAIGDKGYWNRGFGSEALMLMLDYGFSVQSLHRISIRVHSFNKRALHVYEKVGFKKAGIEREARLIAGKYHDTYILDMLADEFKTYFKSQIKVS